MNRMKEAYWSIFKTIVLIGFSIFYATGGVAVIMLLVLRKQFDFGQPLSEFLLFAAGCNLLITGVGLMAINILLAIQVMLGDDDFKRVFAPDTILFLEGWFVNLWKVLLFVFAGLTLFFAVFLPHALKISSLAG